jgi:hypothetical protein
MLVAACGGSSGSSAASAAHSSGAGTASVAPQASILQLSGVSTTVDLDPGTAGVLQQNHVSVTPVAPATATVTGGATSVSFPITAGYVALYPTNDLPFVRGTFSHDGGLTFAAGGKSLTATDFVVNPGTSTLTATVAGKGVPLLDLDGSGVRISKDAQGRVHLDGTVAKLSSVAANALDTTFGVSLFKAGIPLGVVHIVATGMTGPGGAPQAEVQQLTGDGTTVDLDTSTAKVLQQNHVTVTPVGPATASMQNGTTAVTFPITNGYVALYPNDQLPFIRGTISHDGGLTLSAGGKSLTATDFIVNPGSSTLTATVGGKAVPLLDLDGSKVMVSKDSQGRIHLDGTVAKLSAAAADALNTTFGVSLFTAGIPLGVVHIVATAGSGV